MVKGNAVKDLLPCFQRLRRSSFSPWKSNAVKHFCLGFHAISAQRAIRLPCLGYRPGTSDQHHRKGPMGGPFVHGKWVFKWPTLWA